MVMTDDGFAPAGNGEAKIKVIGVGGGGGNALNRMISEGLQGVEFWAINTDAQALAHNLAPNKLQIGTQLTRGLGCGGNPDLGYRAAMESVESLRKIVSNADLLFVTAGLGGGSGTGAAPLVAKLSREAGILTTAVVTLSFTFEGRRRQKQGREGLAALRDVSDCVIVIPNDNLLESAGPDMPLQQAFACADDILRQGVQSITDMITTPGLINVDFADIRTVMSNSGTAMLGIGVAEGKNRARDAATQATSAPLIQTSIEQATGIVFNITGGTDLTLAEVNTVSQVVNNLTDASNCNIIFGTVIDEAYQGKIKVTIIATGFPPEFEDTVMLSSRSSQPAAASAPGAREALPLAAAGPAFAVADERPAKSTFMGRNIL